MKRILPISLTIFIAAIAGLFVAQNQNSIDQTNLLSSTSVTDQLQGIESISSYPFDKLVTLLNPLLSDNSDASKVAQNLLVKSAFRENRIKELQQTEIEPDFYNAALWWNNKRERQETIAPAINPSNISPWALKLLAIYDSKQSESFYSEVIGSPVRDRDGSVMLCVLAIHKRATTPIEPLIHIWEHEYDIERQRAALLLSAIRNLPLPKVSLQNELITTLHTIINEKNFELAWRTLHHPDGTINPDIALAAMIVDYQRFTPILVETAMNGKWVHPEHAILIADAFWPTITDQIPFALLKNRESRRRWWTIFACGLLKEGG